MPLFKGISKRTVLLLIFDITAIAIAFNFSFFIRTGDLLAFSNRKILILYPFYNVLFLSLFYIFDLYYPFKYFKPIPTFIDVVFSSTVGILIAATIAYIDRSFILSRLIFVYTVGSLIVLIFLGRMVYDIIFRSRFLDHKALILGTGALAEEIAQVIQKTPYSGIDTMGIVAETKATAQKKVANVPILGTMADLISLMEWYGVTLIVLALDPKKEISEADVMGKIFGKHVMVTSSIHLLEKLTGNVPYELLGSHYLVGLISQVRTRPYLKLKRVVDILLGSFLLIALSPPLLLSIIVLAFSGPSKIFFIQKRIGKEGIPFYLIKLRSMTTARGKTPLVTRFGKWIRKYRVDEIPQLINVIKSDMSLIGPRPEIEFFANRCRTKIPFYDAIYSVKPGITGWAQVNFKYTKNMKDYKEKFRYNLFYLKNMSLTLDFIILLKTIRIVIQGRGQ